MRIKYPLSNAQVDIVVEDTNRRSSKRSRTKNRPTTPSVPAVESSQDVSSLSIEEITQTAEPLVEQSDPTLTSESNQDVKQPVLMVEVENVQHDKFRKTEEVKVRFDSNDDDFFQSGLLENTIILMF